MTKYTADPADIECAACSQPLRHCNCSEKLNSSIPDTGTAFSRWFNIGERICAEVAGERDAAYGDTFKESITVIEDYARHFITEQHTANRIALMADSKLTRMANGKTADPDHLTDLINYLLALRGAIVS